jgi:hypothetical protein
MPATETQTVGLDLVGNFGSKAETDAKAALKMAEALDALEAASAKVRGAPKSASDAMDALAAKYIKTKEAAEKAATWAAKFREEAALAYKAGNKGWGDTLSAEANKLHPHIAEEKNATALGYLGGLVGDTLEAGAAKASPLLLAGGAAAAAAIVAASAYMLEKGVELGVRQTSEREAQTRILDKLTQGQGDLAYRVTMSLAGEKGVDPATAAERVKGLIQAGFDRSETEILFRASADLGEVKGAEKGKTFLELLEKTAAKGKVNEESLNDLAEAGVEAAGVLDLLRQKGEGLDAVRTRVKAGQVSVADFTKAVGGAVSAKLGGAAGNGLDAELNRAKITAASLFDDFDLSPVEGALKAVQEILVSPTGTELKDGIKDVGDSLLSFLDPLKTEKGKADLKLFFHDVAGAAHDAAEVIREVEHGLGKVVDAAVWVSKAYKEIRGTQKLAESVADNNGVIDLNEFAAKRDAERYGTDDLAARDAARKAGAEARAAGLDVAKGYADGLEAGKPLVDKTMRQLMEEGAIEPANEALDRHSPSKVFAGMGRDSVLGYAKGANDNAAVASDATADMAEQSIAAARRPGLLGPGGLGASGGGGAGAAGVVVQMGSVVVQVTAAPGVSVAEARAMGEAAGDGFVARVQAVIREMSRDNTEFARVGALR